MFGNVVKVIVLPVVKATDVPEVRFSVIPEVKVMLFCPDGS
jgi:hypothetical protein